MTFNGGLSLASGDYFLKSLPGTLVLNAATTGAGATFAENGVNYTASGKTYSLNNNSGGALVLGNASALGSGAFVFEAPGILMASTALTGASAVANNIVLVANTGTSAPV